MIDVVVNDEARKIPEGTSVESLLNQLGLQPRFLAVELNRQVIPKRDHSQTMLKQDDRVEIVTLVGGG
jgi:thiamine biosynthesis protein ThiS